MILSKSMHQILLKPYASAFQMVLVAIMMTNGKLFLVHGVVRNIGYVMEIEVQFLFQKAIQTGRISK